MDGQPWRLTGPCLYPSTSHAVEQAACLQVAHLEPEEGVHVHEDERLAAVDGEGTDGVAEGAHLP